MFFRVRVPLFRVRVPAWFYRGAWFQYQLIEADVGLYSAAAHRGGVAFFVHVGGFLFGVVALFFLTIFWRPAPKLDPFAYLDD